MPKPARVDVRAWATKAEPGARVAYARFPAGEGYSAERYADAMNTAWGAHEQGLVFLSQRREGEWIVYEATRISEATHRRLDRVSNHQSTLRLRCSA